MQVSREEVDVHLDLSGLHCPIPVNSCKALLLRMQTGQCAHVITTDPSALREIPLLVKTSGEQLLGVESDQDRLHFFIIKQTQVRRMRCKRQPSEGAASWRHWLNSLMGWVRPEGLALK